MKKPQFVPLSLSVGVLAALWTYASIKLGLPTWAGFIGWAFFFVAGADTKAIIRAGIPILVGVLFGHASLYGLKLGGEPGIVGISIVVGVAALVLVLLMNWEPLALATASFGGFAVFFAFTFGKFASEDPFAFANIGYSLLTLFICIVLGYLALHRIVGLTCSKGTTVPVSCALIVAGLQHLASRTVVRAELPTNLRRPGYLSVSIPGWVGKA